MKKEKHGLGVLALICAAVLWSSSGVLIKYVEWNSFGIAAVRSALALLVILPLSRRKNWHFSLDQLGVGCSYAGMMLCFVTANKWTTAANAILLQDTAPIYAILLGTIFLKEKIRLRDVVTMGAIISGMVLFFFDEVGGGALKGNLLAILSGVFLAFMIIFMRRLKEGRIEGIILGNIAVILVGSWFIYAPWPSSEGWASLVFLGIFQIGISFVLYSWSISHVSTAEQILIPTIEPILNPIWVFLFLGEQPGFYAMIGGGVVLFSVTARCLWDVRHPIKIQGKG